MVKESYSYFELRQDEDCLRRNCASLASRMYLIQLMYEAVGLQIDMKAHDCLGARMAKQYTEMTCLPLDQWMFKRMVQKDWKDATGESLC